MPIIIACPSCGGKLRVSDELRGQLVRCPSCAHTFDSAPPDKPSVPDLPLQLAIDEPSAPRPTPSAGPPGLVGAVELKLSLDDDSPSSASPPAPPPSDPAPRTPPRLADEHDDLRECPACGKHLHRDSRRCYHCGARVGGRRREGDLPDLRRRAVRRDTVPDRGAIVLTMGILSLASLMTFCAAPVGAILGLISWIMGGADLRKMKRGEMDSNGEGMTRAGWICGIIGTLLNGLLTLGCLGLWGSIWYSENNRPYNTRPYVAPPPNIRTKPNNPMLPNNPPPPGGF